jgi:multidrug resistance efflux pump
MKKFIIFLAVILFSYDAKVMPFDEFDIKSDVSGKIIYANKDLEAKNLKNEIIIKIDSFSQRVDINNTLSQISILKQEIKNQKEIVKRKKATYLKYKNLKTKSQLEKDLKFYDYIASFNQLLNLKKTLFNLQNSLKKLKDIVNRKIVKVNGYLYQIYVNKGDYATPGRLLAKVYDVSKEKLYVYVPIDEIKNIQNKSIYINGKKSNFKITKIYKIPDESYITSYKVELLGNGLKIGDIVKVEFR